MTEESRERRRYRHTSAWVIVTIVVVSVVNLVTAMLADRWWLGILSGASLGVAVFIAVTRHRILHPPSVLPPWAEVTVNGATVARFRAIVFPPGTTMQVGLGMAQNPDNGDMALAGIEVVTSITGDDDDEGG